MDKKKTDSPAFESLACYRLGLRADGGPFDDLGCCPSYGSIHWAEDRWGEDDGNDD